MDKLVLAQKLESLRRCVTRIEQKLPDSAQQLTDDADLQDVIVLNLTRAVQLCTDIATHIISESSEHSPTTMSEAFVALEKLSVIDNQTAVNLRKAVGFRNIAVHNYEAINWEIVYNICHRQLADFKRFAQLIVVHAKI
jgi:uncharacterized protein YutE (UPF0331/DUF86 family)